MIIELSLLNKNHTDTLIEQTETRAQETLEFKLIKQMEIFSFVLYLTLSDKEDGC